MAMDREEVHDVVIVGAGIAGLATAVAMKITGVQSLVLERAPELRATGTSITLASNAWRALEALGVMHKLTSIYQPLLSSRYTDLETGVTRQVPLGRNGVLAVHRKVLLETLAEELPPGSIRFSTKLVSIETGVGEAGSSQQATTTLLLDDGTVLKTKVLIGCDGVHSAVAQWLGLAPAVESGRSAIRALSVFPEGHGFKHEVNQFLGHGMRAAFLPLNDTDVFWALVHFSMATEKEVARDPKLILKEVSENLCKDFPPEYLKVVHHSDLSSITWAPLVFRVPWNVLLGRAQNGCVTVAGDAMHPMTPDLAQGGCTALEDAIILTRNIIGRARSSSQIEKGIKSYVKERRWRTAGIIAMSYLFGWAQQGGTGGLSRSLANWFRDHLLYRFFAKHLRSVSEYDCGGLEPEE